MADTGTWDFFITVTANDNYCPGLAQLKEHLKWVYRREREKLDAALQNVLPIFCRLWERYVRSFFDHLLVSGEDMFGAPVQSFWYRFEFQNAGSLGNLPHVHGGIVLAKKLTYQKKLEYTTCRQPIVFGTTQGANPHQLREKGIIIKRRDGYYNRSVLNIATCTFATLNELYEKLHSHDCKKARQRCMKRTNDGTKKCRYPKHDCSFHGSVMTQIPWYCYEVTEHLIYIGLADRNKRNMGLPEVLLPKKFRYGAGPTGVVSPTNGKLFALFGSSTNVQLCDEKFCVSYVCKYAAGTDEKRDVTIHNPIGNPEELFIKEEDLYNIKISGATINENRHRKNYDPNGLTAQEVCTSEMMWFLLGLPRVSSSCQYVYVKLAPPESRGALKNSKLSEVTSPIVNEDRSIVTVTSRSHLPEWRRFTQFQEGHIREMLNSAYEVDNIASFNVRPPELACVSSVEDYLRWFCINPVERIDTMDEELMLKPFIDGLGRVIKVRIFYLKAVIEFLQGVCDTAERTPVGVSQVHDLFRLIMIDVEVNNNSEIVRRFVDERGTSPVVVFYYHVAPTNSGEFLYYFILKFGKISCEREVFSDNSFRSAFQKCGLLRNYLVPTVEEFKALLRMYVLEELAKLDIRKKKFESMLKLAWDMFRVFLFGNNLMYAGPPLVTELAIQEHADKKLVELEKSRRNDMLNNIFSMKLSQYPERAVIDAMYENINADNTCDWEPVLTLHGDQSNESLQEQQTALSMIINKLKYLFDPTINHINSAILVGPPGSGKTYLAMNAVAYCLSHKIKCIVMSLTADRSRALGGVHMHVLFGMHVHDGSDSDVNKIVDSAIKCLMRSPHKLAFLKRLQVLVYEEIGLISNETLCTIDKIMKFVKANDRPFGGCILIATGDHRQLSPISGSHVWGSSLFTSTMEVLCLKHLVRSSGDQDLQKLISIMRTPKISLYRIKEAVSIIERRCAPQSVLSWDAVDQSHLRIVSTKAAVKECEAEYLKKKLAIPGATFMKAKAVDEMCMRGSDAWVPASENISIDLDYKVSERRVLYLFIGSVMQLTFNNNNPSRSMPVFSQSQRCIITRLPESDGVAEPRRGLHVRLMPQAASYREGDVIPDEWPLVILNRRKTHSSSMNKYGSMGRRDQWPLRYYICQTIHKTMGDTVDRIATMVTGVDMFKLWEREMLLVLMSRVRNLDHIVFVGSFQGTIRVIRRLLKKVDPLVVELDNRIKSLNALDKERSAILRPIDNRFRAMYAELPCKNVVGYVYMLISSKRPEHLFIQNSIDIRDDLLYFNSSVAKPSSLHLQPWLLAGYACNFPTSSAEVNRQRRLFIQRKWKSKCSFYTMDTNLRASWQQILNFGAEVVQEYNYGRHNKITFNICLTGN